MARSLFDPDKAPGAKKSPKTPSDKALSVTDLAALISGALRDHLPAKLRVVGEISGFTDRTHWYFRLKDEGAVLDCVMFASQARRVRFDPGDGQQVVLTGRVEYYAKSGRTQFYVQKIEPLGAGELELRFRALCDELRDLGWFDESRKQPLTTFPRRIAIITSKTGAALQDVLDTMRRRCPAIDIALIDVRVQGESAAPEIARALRWLSNHHQRLGIDAVLLTRGGGSLEDLWAFNERIVAQAIVEARLPVVAAIGHETDITVAELVADARCATPTQAAMRLSPDRESLQEQLAQLSSALMQTLTRRVRLASNEQRTSNQRLLLTARQRYSGESARLERLGSRLIARKPEAVCARRRARVEELGVRLTGSFRARLGYVDLDAIARDFVGAGVDLIDRARRRIDALDRELVIASPQSVLARGYSVTTDSNGRAIRSANAVRSGQQVSTRLADGSFSSTVDTAQAGTADSNQPAPEPPPRPSNSARPRRSRQRRDTSQMDLF